MTRTLSARLLAALAACLLASPAAAQAVRGRVADVDAARPAVGVLVVLLDASGAQRAAALTDSLGTFFLPAPAAGSWRVRVERVGRGTVVDGPFALADGETREAAYTLRTVAIALDPVVVRGRRGQCRLARAQGEEAQALWEEARKALNGTAWAQEQREGFVVQGATYRRDLDPRSMRVRSETRESHTWPTLRVFAAMPVERLRRDGYVRRERDGSSTYYAPDAEVLLSDAFLDTHCMVAQTGGGPDSSLVGLAFRPARGHGAPDVEGVLWMDPTSFELRFLEYSYVRLDPSIPAAGLGGRVEFDRLASGEWMVRRWWVRTPVMVLFRGISGMLYPLRRSLRETGGEITSVARGDGGTLRAHTGAAVSGVVWDSASGRTVAGATAFLAGTRYRAETDSAGRFRIADVPPGEYGATFHTPELDSAGIEPPAAAVAVGDADVDGLTLAMPADGREAADRTFTREMIERLRPPQLRDLFRAIPQVETDSAGIRFRTAEDSPEGCVPTLYRFGEKEPESPAELDRIDPAEVETVAVYLVAASAPEQYRPRHGCGVIVVRLHDPAR